MDMGMKLHDAPPMRMTTKPGPVLAQRLGSDLHQEPMQYCAKVNKEQGSSLAS